MTALGEEKLNVSCCLITLSFCSKHYDFTEKELTAKAVFIVTTSAADCRVGM